MSFFWERTKRHFRKLRKVSSVIYIHNTTTKLTNPRTARMNLVVGEQDPTSLRSVSSESLSLEKMTIITLLYAYVKLTNQIKRIAVRLLLYGQLHLEGQIIGEHTVF